MKIDYKVKARKIIHEWKRGVWRRDFVTIELHWHSESPPHKEIMDNNYLGIWWRRQRRLIMVVETPSDTAASDRGTPNSAAKFSREVLLLTPVGLKVWPSTVRSEQSIHIYRSAFIPFSTIYSAFHFHRTLSLCIQTPLFVIINRVHCLAVAVVARSTLWRHFIHSRLL